MSENQYPSQFPAQPARKPKKSRKWLAPVLVAVALFAGIGIGNASAEPGTVTNTVTKEVKVPGPVETKEVEVVKEVEVTPQVCKDALDLADESFSIFSEIMGALGELDLAEVERLNGTLDPDRYNQLKLECHLGGI